MFFVSLVFDQRSGPYPNGLVPQPNMPRAARAARPVFPRKTSRLRRQSWHGIGLSVRVLLRKWLARIVTGLLILVTALVTVGVTAPADGPFSIAITPVFLQLDATALAESRGRALGVDIDVKIGSMHMHFGWTPVPLG